MAEGIKSAKADSVVTPDEARGLLVICEEYLLLNPQGVKVQAMRMELLVKQRIESKAFDDLLPDVEKLLALRPDLEYFQKFRIQLLERQQKQIADRDEAITRAMTNLSAHDYEGAEAALAGVAAAALTPNIIGLRQKIEKSVRQVRELATRIRDAKAANQFDDLLVIVDKYLKLKPLDGAVGALRQFLVEREQKLTADIAAQLNQAESLEKVYRFDEAAKLLPATPVALSSTGIVLYAVLISSLIVGAWILTCYLLVRWGLVK